MNALDGVTKIALALPGAECEKKGDHAIFRVKKKVFAYFLNSHHGDGIVSICGKTLPGDHTALVASAPKKFYLPAYIGPRGWVGLRLDVGKIDWEEVGELLKGSYMMTVPRATRAKPARRG